MPQSAEPTQNDAPFANIVQLPYKSPTGEVIELGPVRLDVLEDGRNTDNRLGALYITLAPHTPGPPQHWHQMHDETFLVLKGEATFYTRGEKLVAKFGDYIVVPTNAPHTFANESDDEVIIYNTFTPAFYVNYFRFMEKKIKESGAGRMTPEIGEMAMAHYATITTGPDGKPKE